MRFLFPLPTRISFILCEFKILLPTQRADASKDWIGFFKQVDEAMNSEKLKKTTVELRTSYQNYDSPSSSGSGEWDSDSSSDSGSSLPEAAPQEPEPNYTAEHYDGMVKRLQEDKAFLEEEFQKARTEMGEPVSRSLHLRLYTFLPLPCLPAPALSPCTLNQHDDRCRSTC